MKPVLHTPSGRGGSRTVFLLTALLLASGAFGQVYGPQGGGMGGMGGPGGSMRGGPGPSEEIPTTPAAPKPDKAAAKAYAAGQKALGKAREFKDEAAKASDPDKKARLLEKVDNAYGQALDQFTEVLRNRPDMYDAWNQVGYVHLQLGAYRESIDDYNHTLALKPDLEEAVAHRAQAYMATDRLDEAKAAYMELFNHARPDADQLLVLMQEWVKSHREAANGVRQADIDAFDKWVAQRDGIAKTAANP